MKNTISCWQKVIIYGIFLELEAEDDQQKNRNRVEQTDQ